MSIVAASGHPHKVVNAKLLPLRYDAAMKFLLAIPAVFLIVTLSRAAEPVSLSPSLQVQLVVQPSLVADKLAPGDLKGRVVLVSFFASWCPPCHKEFRHLNALHGEFGDKGLRIVAINRFEDYAGTQDGGARLDRFLSDHAPRFFVIRGSDAIGAAFEDVQRIPTVFIFDGAGKKRFHFIHAEGASKMNPSLAELRAVLTSLLGAP